MVIHCVKHGHISLRAIAIDGVKFFFYHFVDGNVGLNSCLFMGFLKFFFIVNFRKILEKFGRKFKTAKHIKN